MTSNPLKFYFNSQQKDYREMQEKTTDLNSLYKTIQLNSRLIPFKEQTETEGLYTQKTRKLNNKSHLNRILKSI